MSEPVKRRYPPEIESLVGNSPISLVDDVVPAVRAILRDGLTEDFLKSCVRVSGFQAFGGGMKADLVGGLSIDVAAVMKIGGNEIALHDLMMQAVNNARAKVFPLMLNRVEIGDGRQLLLMESLRGYLSLSELLYSGQLSTGAIPSIVQKVARHLEDIRSAGTQPRLVESSKTRHWQVSAHSPFSGFRIEPNPFGTAIRDYFAKIAKIDRDVAQMFEYAGEVMSKPCPSISAICDYVDDLMTRRSTNVIPFLQHGDTNGGNILIRRYGSGFAVRLIDPNPEAGYLDPLYDYGKLFHHAEPVGWAVRHRAKCCSNIEWDGPYWRLKAWVEKPGTKIEKSRKTLVSQLLACQADLIGSTQPPATPAEVHVAIARGHLGMAALLTSDDDGPARRFVLAHALLHLANAVHGGTETISILSAN